MDERKCYEEVLEEVKPYINRLYAYFKEKRLEMMVENENPEKQLKEMVDKRYLSPTYITDLIYVSSCLFEGLEVVYQNCLYDYKIRVENFLDM